MYPQNQAEIQFTSGSENKNSSPNKNGVIWSNWSPLSMPTRTNHILGQTNWSPIIHNICGGSKATEDQG